MAVVRHHDFLKFKFFLQSEQLSLIFCTAVPNFIKIYPCGDNVIFVIFKMATAAILDFRKFEILTVDPLCVFLPDSSKSVKRLQRYGDLTVFKMAAVRHVGFVGRVLGPPTINTRWSLSHTHTHTRLTAVCPGLPG